MDSKEQISASYLRERFLSFLTKLEGKHFTAILYDNTEVKATFVATTGAYDHIAVEELHTPIGIVSSALIRTKDIQKIEINID